jgi:hypothetical protein
VLLDLLRRRGADRDAQRVEDRHAARADGERVMRVAPPVHDRVRHARVVGGKRRNRLLVLTSMMRLLTPMDATALADEQQETSGLRCRSRIRPVE